jgi:acetyltransferase
VNGENGGLMGKLENMLNPKVVALIGASEKEGSVGNQIMRNLLIGKEKRKIYPINPNHQFTPLIPTTRQ